MRISDWSSDVCSSDLPDPITIAGEYNGMPSGATSGDYDVNELYVEFNVPLMRDGWLGKSLDLSLAERYSDYSTFGGESTGKIRLRRQLAAEQIGRESCRERVGQ